MSALTCERVGRLTVCQSAGKTEESRYKREHEMKTGMPRNLQHSSKKRTDQVKGRTAPYVKGPSLRGVGGVDICARVGL